MTPERLKEIEEEAADPSIMSEAVYELIHELKAADQVIRVAREFCEYTGIRASDVEAAIRDYDVATGRVCPEVKP